MAGTPEVLFRDNQSIQPDEEGLEATKRNVKENHYATLKPAAYVACPVDIWLPTADEDNRSQDTAVTTSSHSIIFRKVQKRANIILDNRLTVLVVFIMTLWALFIEDVALAVPLDKAVDVYFAWFTLVFLMLFFVEQVARSIFQYEEYCAPQFSNVTT